jgi:hypothetical protein
MITEADGILFDGTSEKPAMLQEARNRGMRIEKLRFHHHTDIQETIDRWMAVTRGDDHCGDVANYKCIIEIKTLSDALNWKHLIWQAIKNSWTGKYQCIIIRDYYNHRYKLTHMGDKSLSHAYISSIEHKFQVKLARMGIPVFYTGDVADTFNRIVYWLEHCDAGPKPVNTFNQYMNRFETPIVMLCGIPRIGEHHARLFFKKAGHFAALADDTFSMSVQDFTAEYSSIKGLDKKMCQKVWRAFHEKVLNI